MFQGSGKKNRVGRLGIFITIFYVHIPIIITFYWNSNLFVFFFNFIPQKNFCQCASTELYLTIFVLTQAITFYWNSNLFAFFKFYFSEFQHNCICYHFFLILMIYKWLHWALFIVLVTDFLEKKLYDQRDVDNVKNNDLYVRQFIRNTESLAETADRLHESLKWRKECGIRGGKLYIVFKDFKLVWTSQSNMTIQIKLK